MPAFIQIKSRGGGEVGNVRSVTYFLLSATARGLSQSIMSI